ncbi:MAG: crotonobetainyl-CoA hydratase [Ilumatobacteraceae bacterium]|nr:crotonobetainyl-CoA hydratase [Ilumatobacteraceae bacterium]MBP7887743.1 crotonobetainyl-CoA hydratase [Ilumatobacteraceae bacterium]MBP8209626.1 crotonobetainyl-CoA hydratase [Ilumatobacteraceae bacterium]
MTAHPGFSVEVAAGVAVLTIDRPKANAIDAATSAAMGEAFLGFEHDPGVRVAIITGAGDRFFSAGWDLGAAADGEDFDADYGVGGFGGFPDLPGRRTPVIAAVNGMAVGGGFEIAMAADLIVAADHAQFFLPEAGIGILPDAGSIRLPRLLPPHVARELLLTGRRMSAAEAAHHGMVNRVVPGAQLLTAALDLAAGIVASAPLSVAAILDIGRRTAQMDVGEAMTAIKNLESYRTAIDSEDAHEGNLSFVEKRSPVWKGR